MNKVKESLREGNIRDKDERKPAEKPVSLHPLKFEEAVQGLAVRRRRLSEKELDARKRGGG